MNNSVEVYHRGKNRIILTEEVTGVAGLRMIGYSRNSMAVIPLKPHIHSDCMEFVAVIKGEQTYYADGAEFKLKGGDLFTSFINQVHGSGNNPQEVNEIVWFQIDMRYKNGFLGLNKQFGKALHTRLAAWRVPVYRMSNEEQRAIRGAFDAFDAETDESAFKGAVMLAGFIGNVLSGNATRPQKTADISRAISMIEERLNDYISLDELAEAAGLSLSRFKHKFAEHVGMTPREYINQQKIKLAAHMLKNMPELSVSDIAARLGFDSCSYFSAVFKKFTGMTPTTARGL